MMLHTASAQFVQPDGGGSIDLPSDHLSTEQRSKIMQNLAKNQIVKSYKGVNGGFLLNKLHDELTILEITKAAEEKTPSVFECSPSMLDCPSQVGNSCTIWPLMNNLQNKVNGFLDSLTLKDISE